MTDERATINTEARVDIDAVRDRWTRAVYTEGFTGTEAADRQEALALCDEIERLRRDQPQWHKFDKDDPATWPVEPEFYSQADCWVAYDGDVVVASATYSWSASSIFFVMGGLIRQNVTHWMPIQVPQPPESAS
jgi:hypothetical protein